MVSGRWRNIVQMVNAEYVVNYTLPSIHILTRLLVQNSAYQMCPTLKSCRVCSNNPIEKSATSLVMVLPTREPVIRALVLIAPREGQRSWYQRHSISEMDIYSVKQLLGGRLSLWNYDSQLGEIHAMVKELYKLTGLGMPEARYVVWFINHYEGALSWFRKQCFFGWCFTFYKCDAGSIVIALQLCLLSPCKIASSSIRTLTA